MNRLEISLYLFFAAIALLPWMTGRWRTWFSASFALLSVGAAAAFYKPAEPPPGNADGLPKLVAGEEGEDYVSSDTCRSCHPGEYDSWHATYHRTMTQVATPQTVLAPFDNVTLQARGRTYHLERRGDEFWIDMADPDWEAMLQQRGADLSRIPNPPRVSRRVFMTTGSHHMQGYWIKSRYGNMMRQVPWFYRIKEQRWIPREDVFLHPPDDKRHFSTWNDACLQCHAVGGKPRMDVESGTGIPHSEVAEFGIACEACHGPAAEHVARHRDPLARYRSHRDDRPDPSIINPARLSADRASEVCGSCHGFARMTKPREFVVDGLAYRPGDDLQTLLPTVRYEPEMDEKPRDIFWADGTCRTGGDEFNAISDSACYRRGELSCLNCHSMHHSDPNDQLASQMETNEACLQCHATFRQRIEEHTHHRAGSAGSLCYNCHMPFSSYALLTSMRSHKIDSPSVEVNIRTGRPNACNLCHLDKTLDWAAGHLTEWFDAPPVETSGDEKTVAASLLWLYRGDAVQRAVAADNLGWSDAQQTSGTNWIAPHLAQLLDDPYAAVRFIGARSLRSLPGLADFEYDYIGPERDRSKAVTKARSLWRGSSGLRDAEKRDAVLLKSRDGIRRKVIERLLSTRDRRPVKVAE